MKLIQLGQGGWTVYAVCRDDGSCPLLDFVETLDARRARKVLSDLCEFVPNSNPNDWVRSEFSWKLRGTDSVLEFRWSTKKGGTPRVYWFYDEGRVVVCARGDNKKGATDQQDISAAESDRDSYLEAKKVSGLTIVTLNDFISQQDEGKSDE